MSSGASNSISAMEPLQPLDRPVNAAIRPWQKALPNWLTGSRVIMSMAFFVVLTLWRFEGSAAANRLTDWWLIASASLFIIAGLTDILDGHLARRWGAESTFGRIMDPFADKLLVIGSLVFLSGPDFWYRTPQMHAFSGHGIQVSGIYPWMVVVIVGRELLVTSIRAVLEGLGLRFGADWSGKVKMLCQSVCIPLSLITTAVTRVTPLEDGTMPWGRWTIDITVWVTVAATVLSGVPYVFRCIKLLSAWDAQRRARGVE